MSIPPTLLKGCGTLYIFISTLDAILTFFNLIHSRNISISERGLLSWDAVLIYAVCFVSACVAADLGNGSSLKDDSIRQPY